MNSTRQGNQTATETEHRQTGQTQGDDWGHYRQPNTDALLTGYGDETGTDWTGYIINQVTKK